MDKEEQLIRKRLTELSQTADRRGIATYSDFLNLNEQTILHSIPKNMLPAAYKTDGGYACAERQIAVFLPDTLSYEHACPIKVLKIIPVNTRFAEPLSHRDYLGAILNLGLERCKIGDLAVLEDSCLVFCYTSVSSYIIEQLSCIRHTVVTVTEEPLKELCYTPKFEVLKGTVASVRLDSVLSVAFPLSRSKLTALIEGGKVFVNGKLMTSKSGHIKEKDILSVRGMGRVSYEGILSETKKGRFYINVHKYV